MANITVLGAGSWGTALAILLAKNDHNVKLWGRNSAQLTAMEQQRCNAFYIPEVKFPEKLSTEVNFDKAVKNADYVLIAIPSNGFRELLQQLESYKKPIIWATKGIEPGSRKMLHQVIAEELGPDIPSALLTGPSFAKEVAQGLPTAVVVASLNEVFANEVIELFVNPYFRPYYCADIVGAEIGGAVKNVLAIAAGIGDGLHFGANTRSALITRGLSEITRLGMALGAKAETFTGLSGLGDLILTCTDDLSRNRRFGLALGSGKTPEEAFADIGQVVEGADNVAQVFQLAQEHSVPMPITEHIYKILQDEMTPMQAVEALFSRDLTSE
jgi:glycerol-3-phosphate dehydrogenase (NAD(P)+)